MYDDVLVPFDGSDGAAAVLEHAADIASWADATIHVLYVADTTRDSVTVVDGDTVDALARQGEDVVDDAVDTLRGHGVDHETDVVQGNPAPTIVEYADRYDHDLILIPTHGRDGISRYLIGSVTEKVVRLSTVPVLAARMQDDERLAFPYENVLVPTDGSPDADNAADHALALAAALDATVHGLSVVEDTGLGPDVRSAAGADDESAAETALDDLDSAAADHGIDDVVRHLHHGSPVDGILDTIDDHQVDAVVMGTTGRRGTTRILLGSVAEKTVRAAPVPVITVPNPDDDT